ncbi:alanine--tRNA ligase [Gammaproteobacteria bacterium]|nr:alanine--tRNA ligase [Gammaproteobacteria bacterium]
MNKKQYLTTNQLRSLFLDYFQKQNHTIVKSSSLVPTNDSTLLFTNAGMVQFKDVFLGQEKLDYNTATSSQRCVRAGGKHNDLENVGYTARHHTFFEMLGNFSFGDYFKKEAIKNSWQFLTEILKIPKEKLWISVYKEDKETADIWINELKIDPNRLSFCGENSNFWSMGPTGPCGPCTEIFYDHGESIPGGPPGSIDEDCDRYIEIWNLVFMQYNRSEDGTMTLLPKPSVDTGMGLERISAVIQGVHNNYDIDLFSNLISSIAKLTEIKDLANTSLRVIADHIRSTVFLIIDGITPSNEGRGYVLRRIIRRALRHGNKLGLNEPFFYKLVEFLKIEMGNAYPEISSKQNQIEQIIKTEEEQFAITLAQGLKLFEQAISEIKNNIIPGKTVFKLYDTYGFPVDLTADIARERNLTIDTEGFEQAMNEQKNRSKTKSKFKSEYNIAGTEDKCTTFTGYHNLKDNAKIIALYQKDKSIDIINAGDQASIILDKTPFYAESGGQVGDIGSLTTEKGDIFCVKDTQKQGHTIIHIGVLQTGQLKLKETLIAEVNKEKRQASVLNHTATHLLHMVLRNTLGQHVIQKGSLVDPYRLRFDFAHNSTLSSDEIKQIELKVNQEIRNNNEAKVQTSSPEQAIKDGALALFEEKYSNEVRVVHFGDSIELCGGTHAHRTGEIGVFKIISESGIASGVRRIEALTGATALTWLETNEYTLQEKLRKAIDQIRTLEKQVEQLKNKFASNISEKLILHAVEINGIKVLTKRVDNLDTKALRITVDQLKTKLGSAVITLATTKENKVSIVSGVTKNLTHKISAKDLIKFLAPLIHGKGGGRPDLAEAGGNHSLGLEKALNSVFDWVTKTF